MEKRLSRKELQSFDGKDGRRSYTAYNGDVYDVTDNPFWAEGGHVGLHSAGMDLTSEFDDAPHGPEVFEGITKVGILED